MAVDRRDLYHALRQKHPCITYEESSYEFIHNELHISYVFRLSEGPVFRPSIRLLLPDDAGTDNIADSLIRNFIFNLGMAELISYWKAACPPRVVIKPFSLGEEQALWWKRLFALGLGEFFYTNGIDPGSDFVHFENAGGPFLKRLSFDGRRGILVPVGGGKDSAVTLELLSGTGRCRPFMLNPWPASLNTARKAGYPDDDHILMFRTIDPQLLQLNAQGYLNGHTPFSALLAFASSLAAVFYGLGTIALSNESSASEPTIPGTLINHQYSKSLAFENDFREYMASHVTGGLNYYSYLRPLNELQIAKIFSGLKTHHDTFRSCNAGSKENAWCGKCPKCLFSFIILSPFLDHAALKDIFGHDLLDDETLLPMLWQLSGQVPEKPFECIGTIDEVNAALQYLVGVTYRGRSLPALLRHYAGKVNIPPGADRAMVEMLRYFGPHNIPEGNELETLKTAIHGL